MPRMENGRKIQVRDNLQLQEFEIPLDFEPRWVDFDPDSFIDKTVQFDQPVDALIAEAEKDPSMMSRLWAAQQLGTTTLANPDARVEALAKVMGNDAFYGVRAAAAKGLGSIGTEQARSLCFPLCGNQIAECGRRCWKLWECTRRTSGFIAHW